MSDEVKVVQSTAEIKVGDILECPHGVLFFVTKILDDLRYQSTVLYSHGDQPANHMECAKRVAMPISESSESVQRIVEQWRRDGQPE